MVFEQFLESNKVKKHTLFIFLIGIFYVLAGYLISYYFLPSELSVAMLFTITLFLVPSISTILRIEEKIESKQGIKHFFHNHKDIVKIFVVLFVGIFLAYCFIGSIQENVFDYQLKFLEDRGDLSSKVISDFKETEYSPGAVDLVSIISYNMFVVVIAFVLSLIYGAGALFLITLNASIFAAFITFLMRQVTKPIAALGIFLIHLIPELSAFLIAAIAGGLVSRAIMTEKLKSKEFDNVLKDSIILLLISLGLIVIAGFLELFVTARLIKIIL